MLTLNPAGGGGQVRVRAVHLYVGNFVLKPVFLEEKFGKIHVKSVNTKIFLLIEKLNDCLGNYSYRGIEPVPGKDIRRRQWPEFGYAC
jgi:hypothetical protein